MDLLINSRLVIPDSELKWRFSRSSGSGGQCVNTTDSRVELVFDLESSSVLGTFRKERLIEKLRNRLIGSSLRVVVSEQRSQYQNRRLALERMADLLRAGLTTSNTRKPTKRPLSADRRRLDKKKFRSQLKGKRQGKIWIDD